MHQLELPPETDAKVAHLLAKLKNNEMPSPTGYFVLCLQWVRPDKVGSIYTAEQTQREDVFQGRCGLVLALGPDCYSGSKFPSGPWCRPGDWVAWPTAENAASRLKYDGVVLTTIPDDRVVMVGVDPARVS